MHHVSFFMLAPCRLSSGRGGMKGCSHNTLVTLLFFIIPILGSREALLSEKSKATYQTKRTKKIQVHFVEEAPRSEKLNLSLSDL